MSRFFPLLLAIGAIAPRAPATAPAAAAEPPPNMVLLFADDLGYGDLSSYGSSVVRTPVIDSLGRDGVRFTRFYANAPECTPSRTALLTGRYQQRVGGLECAIGNGNVGRYDEAVWLRDRDELGLPHGESSLARRLQQTGYATGIFGKWHLGYDDAAFGPNGHGFDEAFITLGGGTDYVAHTEPDGISYLRHNGAPVQVMGYLTDVFAARAIAWMRRQKQPFFVYLPFTAPHSPYQAPDDGPEPLPWDKGDLETYRQMIERLDRRVGDVLAALAELPGGRNTIVVFISDNGAVSPGTNRPLRGWKGQLWEGGIRVPCLVRWPGHIPAGQVSPQVAMNADITATLLAAAGAAPQAAAPLDGLDLLPVLSGVEAPFARTIYFRYKRLAQRRLAVMSGDRKYVWDNGEKWLVDLAADPGETRNLASACPTEVAQFEQMLAAWQADVRAPRLDARGEPQAIPLR